MIRRSVAAPLTAPSLVELRAATLDDFPTLSALFAAFLAEAGYDADTDVAMTQRFLNASSGTLVAEHAVFGIVGFLLSGAGPRCAPERGAESCRSAQLAAIWVDPAVRRLGIGGYLMHTMAMQAVKHNRCAIEALVDVDRGPEEAFFDSLGFFRTSPVDDDGQAVYLFGLDPNAPRIVDTP